MDDEIQILEDSTIHSSSSSWSHHQSQSDQNQSPQPQQGFSDRLSMSFKVINEELVGRNRELEKRLRLVELQVAACLEGQSMLTQLLHKCDMLESRLKTMKEEIQEMNGRLKEFENELRSHAPVHAKILPSSKLEMPDNQSQESGQDSSGRNRDVEETDTDYLNPEPEGQDHDESDMDTYLTTSEFKPYQCGPEPAATKNEDFAEQYMFQHRANLMLLERESSILKRIQKLKLRMQTYWDNIQPTIEENHNTHLPDKENSTPSQSNLNQRKPTDRDGHRDVGSQPNGGHKCSDCGRIFARSHHVRRHQNSVYRTPILRCNSCRMGPPIKNKLMLHKSEYLSRYLDTFRKRMKMTTNTRTILTTGQKSDPACSSGGRTVWSALDLGFYEYQKVSAPPASTDGTEVPVLNLLKPKPYLCKECGNEYKFRNSLERHFTKVHREVRPVSSTFGRDMSPLHIKKKHLYQQPAANRRKGGGQKWR